MRIRVPSRAIAVGFFLALLCLAPSFTPVAHAKPISYVNLDSPDQPLPPAKGDNDGGVLAASMYRPAPATTQESQGTATKAASESAWSTLRTAYSVGGLSGILALLRLNSWLFQLR
jgi:hypothetical protein